MFVKTCFFHYEGAVLATKPFGLLTFVLSRVPEVLFLSSPTAIVKTQRRTKQLKAEDKFKEREQANIFCPNGDPVVK